MKILVIDDSGVQRKMIISIIRQAGFNNEILEAANGNQGIEKLGTNHTEICLILCDWNMPELSGIEFIAAVGQIPALCEIPLIMVTTEGTDAKMAEARSKHPKLAGYVAKPFTPDQLKAAIAPYVK